MRHENLSYDYYKSAEGESSDSSPNNSEQAHEERKVPEMIKQMQLMSESPDEHHDEGQDDMDEDQNSCASSVIVPFSQSQLRSSDLNDIQRQMLKKENDRILK